MSNSRCPELKLAMEDPVPSYEEATRNNNNAPGQNTGTHLDAPGPSRSSTLARKKSTRQTITGKIKGLFGGGSSSSSSGEKNRRNSALPEVPQKRFDNAGEKKDIQQPTRAQTILATDDELQALAAYDTVFIIDDSGSMHERTSKHTNETHWEQAGKVLENLVEICSKFDTNGIDVYFLNSMLGKTTVKRHGRSTVDTFVGKNITDTREAMKLFRAREAAGIQGSTPTAESLALIIDPYVQECVDAWTKFHAGSKSAASSPAFPKPVNVIVITDGAANSNEQLIRNMGKWARELDRIEARPDQVGFQFFQIGNMEGVKEFLLYLDNALSEEAGFRDMIDTKGTDEMGETGLTGRRVLTTVLGAVNRRLDREMDWQALGMDGPPRAKKMSSEA
ncbi:hypothetical protein DFH27DRAFT_551813 [Peziza echinospora]|nr:hypothetical protein DFH27DRAFT_551813 [Peziza echinospora]